MNFLAEPPFLPSPSSDAALADEAQERYCALASASSLVVWGTTPSGEFFERETGWQEFTGQSPQDARGFGWLAQVHPDDVVPLHAVWSRAAQTEQPFETEYRVHHHSGEFRRVRARGVPVRQNGEVVEWIGTLTDIEDARRAQQLLSEEQTAFTICSGTTRKRRALSPIFWPSFIKTTRKPLQRACARRCKPMMWPKWNTAWFIPMGKSCGRARWAACSPATSTAPPRA